MPGDSSVTCATPSRERSGRPRTSRPAHEPDAYESTFAPDRAIFRRVDPDIETRTEIVVSPEDDAELRRVSVTNLGNTPRRLDLTSYAEVVLAPADADLAHPAFSNLFIETLNGSLNGTH